MTEIQNKILAYLVANTNTDNEITISNKELAEHCNVSIPTIQKFQKDSVADGLLQYEKGKYIINENTNVDYTYQISKYVKDNNLNLTTNEKKVLGFITKMCEEMQFDLASISYDTISDNCKITIPTATRIVKKLIADGLIAYEQGDYKKKIANKYKVLFGNTVQNPIVNNNNPTIDNNTNNNININIPDNTEVLNKILHEITELKKSMIHQANKFNAVEGVAKMLLDYIEEIHSDMDNLYMINNIQVPKSEKRINIQEIRKYLDTF